MHFQSYNTETWLNDNKNFYWNVSSGFCEQWHSIRKKIFTISSQKQRIHYIHAAICYYCLVKRRMKFYWQKSTLFILMHTCVRRFGDGDRARLDVFVSRDCAGRDFLTSAADCSESAISLARIRSCTTAWRFGDFSFPDLSSLACLPPAILLESVCAATGLWPASFVSETYM